MSLVGSRITDKLHDDILESIIAECSVKAIDRRDRQRKLCKLPIDDIVSLFDELKGVVVEELPVLYGDVRANGQSIGGFFSSPDTD